MTDNKLRTAIEQALFTAIQDQPRGVGGQVVSFYGFEDMPLRLRQTIRDEADAVLAVLAENPDLVGDEYHSMAELYEYRMLYNAHAVKAWLFAGIPVVKSWRHSDGEECFGGGWFIVTAQLPTGQVSNHYKAEHWGLFACPSVEKAPTYDGHTPQVAAVRLRAAFGGEQSDG